MSALHIFTDSLEVNLFEKKTTSSLVTNTLKQNPALPNGNRMNLLNN